MSTLQYTTVAGDRWDTVAFKAYGEPGASRILIIANPTVKVSPELTAGTLLNIPVIPDGITQTATELLPPWK